METVRDLGVDFHSNRFTVCFLEDGKRISKTYELAARTQFYSELRLTDTVTIEAMNGTFNFVREFEGMIQKCNIIDPAKFGPKHKPHKTDKIDALKLAEAGRNHRIIPGYDLPLVYLPEKKISELRSLFTARDNTVVDMTRAKNLIHAILKDHLMPFNEESLSRKETREKIFALSLGAHAMLQIRQKFDLIDVLEKQKKEIDEEILRYTKEYQDEVKIMISVSGVSILMALCFKADYAEISRFGNAKRFCSYMRSAPKVQSSNETVLIGHINKASRRRSLSLLLQGLRHVHAAEGRMKDFRERKIMGKSRGKVRIALARKVFVAIYHMVKNKELYNEMNETNYLRKLEEVKKFAA